MQQHMANKVPQVTIYFWIIKILATTVGETAADFLSERLHLGLVVTSYIMGAVFLIALAIQMKQSRYIRPLYWAVVVLISIMGTLISDNLSDNLGISLVTTTIAFSVLLAIVFALWWASEHDLSVHTITTTKREGFYWATILFTFALGTSGGDLLAEKLQLGYPLSALVFLAAIGVAAFAYYRLHVNGVLAFWFAYIMTRPLGASLGDLLSQPVSNGGVGFGTTLTSAVFLSVIAGLIVYLTLRDRRKLEPSGSTV